MKKDKETDQPAEKCCPLAFFSALFARHFETQAECNNNYNGILDGLLIVSVWNETNQKR